MQRCLYVSVALVALWSNPSWSEEQSRLGGLEDIFAREIRKIEDDQSAALNKLKNRVLERLEELSDTFRKDGDLDGLLAAQTARKAFRNNEPLPPKAPASIEKLSAAYGEHRHQIKSAADSKRTTLIKSFVEKLKSLQVDLTRRNDIEAALKVRDRQEQLLAEYPRVFKAPSEERSAPATLVALAEGAQKRPAYLARSMMVNGFSKALKWQSDGGWETFRDEKVQSYWANVSEDKEKILEWETPRVERRQILVYPAVTFLFSGGTGFREKTGTWKVELNGQPIMTVQTPVQESKVLQGRSAKLYVEHYGEVHLGYKSLFFLTVPRNLLKPGKAQNIAWIGDHQSGDEGGWIMVNEYPELLEQLNNSPSPVK